MTFCKILTEKLVNDIIGKDFILDIEVNPQKFEI